MQHAVTYRLLICHVLRYHDPWTNVLDPLDPSENAAGRGHPSAAISPNFLHLVARGRNSPPCQAARHRRIACEADDPSEDSRNVAPEVVRNICWQKVSTAIDTLVVLRSAGYLCTLFFSSSSSSNVCRNFFLRKWRNGQKKMLQRTKCVH